MFIGRHVLVWVCHLAPLRFVFQSVQMCLIYTARLLVSLVRFVRFSINPPPHWSIGQNFPVWIRVSVCPVGTHFTWNQPFLWRRRKDIQSIVCLRLVCWSISQGLDREDHGCLWAPWWFVEVKILFFTVSLRSVTHWIVVECMDVFNSLFIN